ncbi:hypothetical protein ABVK25_004967 [Lepraria finkii]|uniref:Uncharacterized protein n=1 Tax=Lepraria finkii TaxID=1340010 RepID=A0ABR4BCX2_9LECA
MIEEINQVLQDEEDKQAKVQAERHRRLEEIEERERRGPLWKNDLMRRFALEECVKWENTASRITKITKDELEEDDRVWRLVQKRRREMLKDGGRRYYYVSGMEQMRHALGSLSA